MRGADRSAHKPVWAPDGKSLFYVPRVAEFEAVAVTTSPAFAFGNAVTVPRPFDVGGPPARTPFDILPDGRFVGFNRPVVYSVPGAIQMVLDAFDELPERSR